MQTPVERPHRWLNGLHDLASIGLVSRIVLYLPLALLLIFAVWYVFWTRFLPLQFVVFIIQHGSPIRLVTAALALVYASVFFWPKDLTKLVGRWNYYVGLVFATFFVQFLFRYFDLAWARTDSALAVHFVVDVVVYLCSGFNNLLFLAAARILLNLNQPFTTLNSETEGVSLLSRLKLHFLNSLAELNAALPKWTWSAAVLSTFFALLAGRVGISWARFPDAIFSFYCVGWFGYAIAINFNLRRRVVLASLALIIFVLYGIGQLIYAMNSVVVSAMSANRGSSSSLDWIQQHVGNPVEVLVGEARKATGKNVNQLEFMDSAVYTVLLPMKWALFLPPAFLYLLFIVSINYFPTTLKETTSRRKDYLSADGIVSAILDSLGAEKVTLFIRLPGIQKRHGAEEERVLPLTSRLGQTVSKRLQETYPIRPPARVLKLMKYENREFDRTEVNGRTADSNTNPKIRLGVPIKFHGGVIGVLEARVKGYGGVNQSTLQKLKLWADLVAPSVQDFRSLAAADQIGFRLTRLQADSPVEDLTLVTVEVLNILHDVLSPLSTGLFLEMGFVPFRRVCPENHPHASALQQQANANSKGVDIAEEIFAEGKKVRLESCPMFVRTTEVFNEDEAIKGPVLGTIGLAIPAEKDVFSQPTLAAYYLNRKTVASLAADGILDLARNFFASIVRDLGVSFSHETFSQEQWFVAISSAIERAGLQWVVAVNRGGEEMVGDPVEFLPDLDENKKAMLLEQSLNSLTQNDKKSLRQAICLNLRRSKYQLWIGVERQGFGPEITFQSPWKSFLTDLADVADSAFKTLQERQAAETEKLNSAPYQGIMTIAVTTGTLMHQLINWIKDQLFATESLEEALGENGIQLSPDSTRLLITMKKSNVEMQELIKAFARVTKMEERKPCSVKEAAEQAVKLFHVALTQRRIKTEILVSPNPQANVPFHVAAFALANLVGNAKEAINFTGTIRIEAEDDGNFILCHVTNSGPKIPLEEQERLFMFGQSSKLGHNGWGLYLVSKSLQENGGGINLDTAHPETRFTIRLPKFVADNS